MSDVAIRVENLSKQYRIGSQQARYRTLRESLAGAAQMPLRRVGSLVRGQADGVHEASETIWALKDVSFEVRQGEVVGVIGRNGAGKSTLLKILSRITEPTQGWAEIHGRVGSLLEVGTGFHPELTGRENIYLNGAILGMRKLEIDHKFDEIVAFAEIEKFLDTPVKHYSSGMYVRLAFSVAAHLEPEILLVDEVLAVGDAAFQKKCLGKMGDVAQGGRTVLFVSHNMAAILNLCKRALLLKSGNLLASGTAGKVVDSYLLANSKISGNAIISRDEGGNTDEFCFHSVTILNVDGHPSAQISLTEGFEVEIEYDINKPIKGANVVFHLWTSSGVCVFSSTDVDQNSWSILEVREPGRYQARCRVPHYFLRAGRYSVGVSSSIPGVRVLANLSQVLSFDVVDTGSVESKIGQGRQGIIAPVLRWDTRRVERTV